MSEAGTLESILLPEIWPEHERMEAECVFMRHFVPTDMHPAPMKDCSCGLHAFYNVPPTWSKWADNEEEMQAQLQRMHGQIEKAARGGLRMLVPGKVKLWGRVLTGDNGCRAQYAYPDTLAWSKNWDLAKVEHIKYTADNYGLDCVELDDLVALHTI